ncbi:uncharacterized protein LOC105005953 isoform X2 [Esox lucius]|uniref:uncharacterized protein LOC105005953 isoform X2 n=1 Tax=Esox lucius TaxID=8010 RepID=UPI001476B665|nr:uncharacterized protein LOC105005953 isoform X2 [Esox lucius]
MSSNRKSKPNRRLFLCEVCLKPQVCLSKHLRHVCMKHSTPEQVKEKVRAAKVSARKFETVGRFWDYRLLRKTLKSDEDRTKMVDMLKERGFIVTNVPKPLIAVPPAQHQEETVHPEQELDTPTAPPVGSGDPGEFHQNTPFDCQLILRVAKKDFRAVISKLVNATAESPPLDPKEHSLVVNYLVALLTLKLLLHARVIRNMTVTDWLNRVKTKFNGKEYVVVGGRQTAAFALNQHEEMWFQYYYIEIRPERLRNNPNSGAMVDRSDELFFLNSKGMNMCNLCTDLERFLKQYKCPKVTIKHTRHSFEDAADESLNSTEVSLISNYILQSGATSENDNLMLHPENVVQACVLLSKLARDPNPESNKAGPSRTLTREYRSIRMDRQKIYESFTQAYPVSLEGVVPAFPLRGTLTGVHDRYCTDRWRKSQRDLRTEHVLSHFSSQLPTVEDIKKWMSRQNWSQNFLNPQNVQTKLAAKLSESTKRSGGMDA